MALPRVHAVVSGVIGYALWRRTGSLAALGSPIVGGFLIDVDHLVDYALFRWLRHERRIILPFHGWELVPLFWWLERRFVPSSGGGFSVGYVVHLLIDQVVNEKSSPLTYSLIYRATQGFRANLLGPQSPKAHAWRQSSLRNLWRWF